jgi:hypothetical protein
VTGLRAAATAALLLALSTSSSSGSHAPACAPDAVTARALTQLQAFTGWLDRNHVPGVIGEVGWPAGPDSSRWEHLAARWYAAAGAAGIGTFAWAGAEQWPADYPLGVYRSDRDGALDVAGPQARLVEHQADARRGVALADGSFAASLDNGSTYSSAHPGSYGSQYRYPSPASLAYLRSRGVRSVRVAFTWERLQPRPGAALSAVELGRLRRVLTSAHASGLRVVLDLHSYGRFAEPGPRVLPLGSPGLPATALGDLWRRVASAVSGSPALAGYGVMNEPHDLPGGAKAWERASQLAVAAVRSVDRTTPVLVAGYSSSSAARWPAVHARPWISPERGPVLYEAHQYFDRDGSGTYRNRYATEDAGARQDGWRPCGTLSQ